MTNTTRGCILIAGCLIAIAGMVYGYRLVYEGHSYSSWGIGHFDIFWVCILCACVGGVDNHQQIT